MTEETEKTSKTKKNKLTSVKFWVTMWAMVMVTFIVITNKTDFLNIAQWLCGVPLAYLGVNVWQKKIYEDKDR